MAEPERIVELAHALGRLTEQKISSINGITREAKYLALNALVESGRAGLAGKGFAIVAQEVKVISERIAALSGELTSELARSITELGDLGDQMIAQLQQHRGQRLTDLALNMIELMDRNLYERSCDVRWWATDSAIVDALSQPSSRNAAQACSRLGVILDSYTVYLDLCVADLQGNVIATGRPELHRHLSGGKVNNERWFKDAIKTPSGNHFAVADVEECRQLGKQAAIYSTAVREGGVAHGKVIGALGIFFDWAPQAQAVVTGIGLSKEEWSRTRCLLVDSRHRVIAASDNQGVLQESMPLLNNGQQRGFYSLSNGSTVGYALTPGYETYRGLGWYGVVVQAPSSRVLPCDSDMPLQLARTG